MRLAQWRQICFVLSAVREIKKACQKVQLTFLTGFSFTGGLYLRRQIQPSLGWGTIIAERSLHWILSSVPFRLPAQRNNMTYEKEKENGN
jgi:hypothetical protein